MPRLVVTLTIFEAINCFVNVQAVVALLLLSGGCANVVPVLYSAVGRQTFMPEHLAVSVITTLGYSGILIGPAAWGFVAQNVNRPFALGSVGVLLIFVTMMGLMLPLALINGEPPK
ncbi:MFS transporter [Gluconobacter japonicus]|uniref:MFS transporter n=1 Tax=Gluconobacter japonicus TaxID=376620 RepID=UPI000A78E0FC|nr:MFS transporter [Gluconobacter japonicus]